MDFTQPIFTGRTLLWYSKKKYPKGIGWNSIEDLIPYKIVMLQHSAMGQPLIDKQKNGVPLVIYGVESHVKQFQMILHPDRYDIAPLTEIVGYHFLRKYGWEEQIASMAKPLSSEDQYYMAFSKKSPARKLIPKINAVIEEMKKSGLIDNLIQSKKKPKKIGLIR